MDIGEMIERMRRMRSSVKEHNIYWWAGSLIGQVCELRLKKMPNTTDPWTQDLPHSMRASSAKAILTEFMGRFAASRDSALLVDYDGTLAPFQALRDRAYPYPGVEPILEKIIQCSKSRVIVLTGRPVRELQTLFRPFHNLEVWGSHGMEHLRGDGTYQQTVIDSEVAAVSAKQDKVDRSRPDILSEIKPGGIAIHWRGESDTEITRQAPLLGSGFH